MRLRALAAALAIALAPLACGDGGLPRGRVTIAGQTVEVEVAHTSEARQQGLSGRTELADGTGMLFLHPQTDYHVYWMKDMQIAIDVLWIRDGRIVDAELRVEPPGPGEDGRQIRMNPRAESDAVLELPAGYASAHGFFVGERVTLDVGDLPPS